MIVTDKIYVLPLSNLRQVKTFAIMHNTPEKVATYLLGRKVASHLLCRPNYPAIILKGNLHGEIMGEIARWMEGPAVKATTKRWVDRTNLLEIRPAKDREMVAPGEFSEPGDMIVEHDWPGEDFMVRQEDFAGGYVEVEVPDEGQSDG